MPDPLAGRRTAIAKGEIDVLIWPDHGQGCPVKVGDLFPLKTCAIEIASIRRVKRGRGEWFWRATFVRINRPSPMYLLKARGRGDYVHSSEGALDSGEERPEWEADAGGFLTVPQGPPPEPEAIPPDEIRELPTSVAARALFERQRQEDIQRRLGRSLVEEVRQAMAEARRAGVDVTEEVEAVREAVAAMEAKRRRVAA